jgi:hypothetical protein
LTSTDNSRTIKSSQFLVKQLFYNNIMDLNNLANMAQQAGNLANNPMAQQILNNDAVSGLVNKAEEMTGMDLNGDKNVGASQAVAQSDVADTEEVTATEE